jgi:hypothetical protein
MAENTDDHSKISFASLRLPPGFAERLRLPPDVAQRLKSLALPEFKRFAAKTPLTPELRKAVIDFIAKKREERAAIDEVLQICERWLAAHGVALTEVTPVIPQDIEVPSIRVLPITLAEEDQQDDPSVIEPFVVPAAPISVAEESAEKRVEEVVAVPPTPPEASQENLEPAWDPQADWSVETVMLNLGIREGARAQKAIIEAIATAMPKLPQISKKYAGKSIPEILDRIKAAELGRLLVKAGAEKLSPDAYEDFKNAWVVYREGPTQP